MRYHKNKKRISSLLACALICNTIALSPVQILANQSDAIETQSVDASVQATTGSALAVEASTYTEETSTYALQEDNFFDASDLTAETITGTVEAGIFTIHGNSDGNSDGNTMIDANSKTADDGTSFTQRLKLGGSIGSSFERSVSFYVSNPAKVTVYAMSSSSTEDRELGLYADDKTLKTTVPVLGSGIVAQTIEIEEAGEYYLASPASGVNIYGILVEETQNYTEMILNPDELAIESISDSKTVDAFTIIGAVDVAANAYIAEDGTSFNQCIKLNGSGNATKRSIHFTTTDKATVEVYPLSGSSAADRNLTLYKVDGTEVASVPAYGTKLEKGTIELTEAGDYYLASPSSGVNVYYLKVTEGEKPAEVVRPDWANVEGPTNVEVHYKVDDESTIEIEFDLETSTDAADKANVIVTDENGNEVDCILVGKSTENHKVAEFKPSSSGTYTFTVVGLRNGETEEKAATPVDFDFTLPLGQSVVRASNKGNGDILVKWTAVNEAETYRVEYKLKADPDYTTGAVVEASDLAEGALIPGLQVDEAYILRVVAIRGTDETASEELEFNVKDRVEREWAFTRFGQSSSSAVNTVEVVDQDNLTIKLNSCSVNADGTVNKKGGKFTTYHDGISYYYTEVDPEKENFVLTATFTVDYLNPTPDGQEGFAILAMDRLGEYGVSSVNHYTNSAAVIATKFDVTVDGTKTSLKDTLGGRFVSGITPEVLNGGDSAIAQSGKNVSTAFGQSTDDLIKQGESYTLTLKKTNTGYHAIIQDENGVEHEQIMYGPEKLLQLDSDKVYVGFAVARGCNVTVSDISMTISDPATDPEAIPEPEEFATLQTKIDSPTTAGSKSYDFVFNANLPGTLTIKDEKGKVLVENTRVEQDTDFETTLKLKKAVNNYTVSFLPDADSRTADGLRIESYDEVTLEHTVTLRTFTGKEIYVSPQGTSDGKGTKKSPVDIYTATNYVKAGQKIVLAGGTYEMTEPLIIARGIDGTSSNKITLSAAKGERAVLNFANAGGGMQLWGSYWHVKGIDVCETPGNIKGLQVAGHYNVIEQVNTYRNGDTGLQISGTSAEGMDKWPSNNLILNCTSYDNCDPGMNNADGFAAKITCGEGNIFRGCAAYNNLDDGWDLFAKIESGPIGAVTIEDSIAFANGTLTDGTGLGDGNGFKLGGDGISVAHVLRNSISFNNNTNGITSNSDPAVVLENNTAYGNKGSNITLYGKGTGDRNFVAENNISMAGAGADDYAEMPSLASENNYFWDGSKSANSLGEELTEEIFERTDVESYVLQRYEDGSIDMDGLLELNDKAPEGIGAVLEPGKIQDDSNQEEDKDDNNQNNQDKDDDDDDDNNSDSTGGSLSDIIQSIIDKIEEMIEEALKEGKVPCLPVDSKHMISIKVELVEKLLKANSALSIEVNSKTEAFLPADTIKECGNSSLELKLDTPKSEVAKEIEALLEKDSASQAVNLEEYLLNVEMKGTQSITSFNEPMQITWEISKDEFVNSNHLTAVRYEEQADGSLKMVKLGGSYDEKTGQYTFLTDQTGVFGLVEVEGLVKVTLSIGEKNAMVNGVLVTNDVAPEVTDDRTMLPIRFVAESLGAKVGWKFGRVTITLGDQSISFKAGEVLKGYGVTPYVKEGRTYISARWIAEELGANVLWVPSTQTVEIVK